MPAAFIRMVSILLGILLIHFVPPANARSVTTQRFAADSGRWQSKSNRRGMRKMPLPRVRTGAITSNGVAEARKQPFIVAPPLYRDRRKARIEAMAPRSLEQDGPVQGFTLDMTEPHGSIIDVAKRHGLDTTSNKIKPKEPSSRNESASSSSSSSAVEEEGMTIEQMRARVLDHAAGRLQTSAILVKSFLETTDKTDEDDLIDVSPVLLFGWGVGVPGGKMKDVFPEGPLFGTNFAGYTTRLSVADKIVGMLCDKDVVDGSVRILTIASSVHDLEGEESFCSWLAKRKGYLDGKSLQDPSTQEMVQAYASGQWGLTRARKMKAWLGIASFIIFVGALISGLPYADYVLPLSSLAMGISLMFAVADSKLEHTINSILLQPLPSSRILRRTKEAVKLLLIPLVMIGIAFHGHELAASIRSSTFFIALLDNYIGGLNMANFVGSETRTYVQPTAMAVLRRIYNAQLLTLAVNQFVKHAKFLLTGQRVDTRYSVFGICWSFTGGISAKIILNTLLNLVDTTVGRISKMGAVGASVVVSISENYVIQSLKAATCVKFVQTKKSFLGAVRSLRLSDLRLWPKGRPGRGTNEAVDALDSARAMSPMIQAKRCLIPE
eukprot:jgi/Bigna1/82138/fgenesh1_pg.88_\